MELVLATRNPHKLREFETLLRPHSVLALPAELTLPEEIGESFAQNALPKALAAVAGTGRAAIADDSGIEAGALGGRPGVRSARFAGEDATDEQNLAKLLREVAPDGDRRVAYVCALAYAEPGGRTQLFEGRCEGLLTHAPHGQRGFGYDPAFIPLEVSDGRTMAELEVVEKNAISHRGRAARALLGWLRTGAPEAPRR